MADGHNTMISRTDVSATGVPMSTLRFRAAVALPGRVDLVVEEVAGERPSPARHSGRCPRIAR